MRRRNARGETPMSDDSLPSVARVSTRNGSPIASGRKCARSSFGSDDDSKPQCTSLSSLFLSSKRWRARITQGIQMPEIGKRIFSQVVKQALAKSCTRGHHTTAGGLIGPFTRWESTNKNVDAIVASKSLISGVGNQGRSNGVYTFAHQSTKDMSEHSAGKGVALEGWFKVVDAPSSSCVMGRPAGVVRCEEGKRVSFHVSATYHTDEHGRPQKTVLEPDLHAAAQTERAKVDAVLKMFGRSAASALLSGKSPDVIQQELGKK